MMEGLDKISLLVVCSVDDPLRDLEKRLHREGFTLGFRPQGARAATLRQALERRMPNRDALLYGDIDDLCVSLQAVRRGETIVTRNVPRAATGPDFKKLLIGSGRRHAKILRAVLRIHPLPQARETARVSFPDKTSRDGFLRSFWGSGIRPVRLKSGARAISVSLEGTKEMVLAERKCLRRLALQAKGKVLS